MVASKLIWIGLALKNMSRYLLEVHRIVGVQHNIRNMQNIKEERISLHLDMEFVAIKVDFRQVRRCKPLQSVIFPILTPTFKQRVLSQRQSGDAVSYYPLKK